MNTTARLSLIAALLAGAGMFSSSALAASALGTAEATVLTPITIAAGAALSFGTFSPNGVAGTVTINTVGARSSTGTPVFTSAGGAGANGTFTVGGAVGATFAVTYPAAFLISSGVNTMSVTVAGSATGTLSGATVTLPVGGTLTYGATQAPGAYTGSYSVAVEYN